MDQFKKGLQLTFLFVLVIGSLDAFSQQKTSYINLLNRQNHWVDSVYKKLSRKQRVAQLFFVRAHTDRGQAFEDSVGNVFIGQLIGGLVFFQGGPVRQLN